MLLKLRLRVNCKNLHLLKMTELELYSEKTIEKIIKIEKTDEQVTYHF